MRRKIGALKERLEAAGRTVSTHRGFTIATFETGGKRKFTVYNPYEFPVALEVSGDAAFAARLIDDMLNERN